MANEVVINVTADTKRAGKGLDSIRDKMKKVGAGATVAGGLITGFATASLKTFAEVGDEVHKMSLRTGFTTEVLSQLRVAADLSGTSLGRLETGVTKMQQTIGDARDGLSMAVDQFDKLGITMDDLKGLTPEEQFIKLLKATAGLEDQNLRTQVAMKLFGKAGIDMMPMLADGTQAFDDMMGKAAELGMEIDQVASEKAAKLTDAMGNMKGSMTGVMMAVGEQLAPVIVTLADKITDLVSGVVAWTEKNPKLTEKIVPVVAAIGGILLVAGPLLLAFAAITAIAPAVGAAFTIMMGPIGIIIAAIAILAVAWAKNFGGIREKTKAVFDFIGNLFESKLGWILPGGDLVKGLLFLKDNWREVWNSITTSFRATINGLIGMINFFIRALNKIKIHIPSIGGLPAINIGFDIEEMGKISAPRRTQSRGRFGAFEPQKQTRAMTAGELAIESMVNTTQQKLNDEAYAAWLRTQEPPQTGEWENIFSPIHGMSLEGNPNQRLRLILEDDDGNIVQESEMNSGKA